jgi:predicted RNA-binding protein associated with RNAse of E/G family
LDWDEFEEAIQNQIITPAQADLARSAMQRLVEEAARGIYPFHYTSTQ